MKKTTQLASIALAFGLIIFGNTHTFAATRTVDDDGAQCPTATFTSIRAAVNASAAGDTVQVCQGRYPEQILINKPLTLQGISRGGSSRPEIQPPAGGAVQNARTAGGSDVAALILVRNTTDVFISNLTVNGLMRDPSPSTLPVLIGIYYFNATGTASNNAVKNISHSTPGNGAGIGIFVSATNTTPRRVDVLNNVIYDYEKSGVIVSESGVDANVGGNFVNGMGDRAFTNANGGAGVAQNGVVLQFGATGNINNNRVANNFYLPCETMTSNCTPATNILLLQPGTSANNAVEFNFVNKSNYGIFITGDGGGAASGLNNSRVRQNNVFDNTFDGIFLDGSNNNINGNQIFASDRAAVEIGDGTGNSIANNLFNDALFGILRPAGSGNTQTGNTFINCDENVGSASTPAPSARNSSAAFSGIRVDTVR